MLKNLKYIVAVGLVALGYTNDASAFLESMSCTAKKGSAGDFSCVRAASTGKLLLEDHPNYVKAIYPSHCKRGPLTKDARSYCPEIKIAYQQVTGEEVDAITAKQAKSAQDHAKLQAGRAKKKGKPASGRKGSVSAVGAKATAKKGQAASKSPLARKGSLASANGKARPSLAKRNSASAATALHPAANTPQAIAKRQQRAKARAKAQSLDTLNDAENLRHIVYGEDDQVREEETLARPNLERQKAISKRAASSQPARRSSMPTKAPKALHKMHPIQEEEGGVDDEALGDNTFDDEQVQDGDVSFDAYNGSMEAADDAEEQDAEVQDEEALFDAYNGGTGAADEEQDEQEQGDEELYDQ